MSGVQIDNIVVSVAGGLSLIGISVFYIYIIYRVIMDDCGLRKKINKKQFEKMNYMRVRGRKMRRRFLNENIRLLCALNFTTALAVIADFYLMFDPSQNEIFCYIQALQMQLMNWFDFMFSLAIAIWLFFRLIVRTYLQGKQFKHMKELSTAVEIALYVLVFTVCILFLGIPFIDLAYGDAGGWCWITKSTFQFIAYYIPLWVIIGICCILYGAVLIQLIRMSIKTPGGLKTILEQKKFKLSTQLLLYPLVFLLTWVIPTINRGLGIANIKVSAISYAHIFVSNVFGFCNVLVYFFNPVGHMKALKMVFCWPCTLTKSILKSSRQEEDDESNFIQFTDSSTTSTKREANNNNNRYSTQLLLDNDNEENDIPLLIVNEENEEDYHEQTVLDQENFNLDSDNLIDKSLDEESDDSASSDNSTTLV
mmetsp:Transcript_9154/g.13540  ORF Transcript_9154/g.13540 Transcript_9154/m.13540 type:complete len:423 (-) Transcript_9154:1215-2483(-)